MRTSSRTVAILLFDEVELLDVATTLQVLTMAGRTWNFRPFKIFSVAARAGAVKTLSQIGLEARHSLLDCPEPEIVVVPGGYGARRAVADDQVIAWLARAGGSAQHVVGVGNGVLLLAKASLLSGVDISAPHDVVDILRELSPEARADTQARWHESGKMITAATAGGALDAALHLVSKLLGKKQALGVAATLGVTWSEGKSVVDILEPPG